MVWVVVSSDLVGKLWKFNEWHYTPPTVHETVRPNINAPPETTKNRSGSQNQNHKSHDHFDAYIVEAEVPAGNKSMTRFNVWWEIVNWVNTGTFAGLTLHSGTTQRNQKHCQKYKDDLKEQPTTHHQLWPVNLHPPKSPLRNKGSIPIGSMSFGIFNHMKTIKINQM